MHKSLAEQKLLYENLWETNSPVLANSDGWVPDPIPLYTIGVKLHESLFEEMSELITHWKRIMPVTGQWLKPEELHITLDIPGRLGINFQDSDIPFIIQVLKSISSTTNKMSVTLGNISCFPHVPFREIYDVNGSFYNLHMQIADAIPWSKQLQFRHEQFVPHLSLFYPAESIAEYVQDPSFSRLLPFREMPVETIYFSTWFDDEEGVLQEKLIDTFDLQ